MLHESIAFGLRIASEFDIPGSLTTAAGGHPDLRTVDLRVVRGPATLPSLAIAQGPYRYNANTLLFQAPTVARYLCDPRASLLTVEPMPHADPEAVAALLIATALPAMLWMRGDLMLHAGGAVLPGCNRAVAFAAPSGFGKTHLLGRLLAEGSDLLAEDVLCLRPEALQPIASGLPACLFERVPAMPSSHRRPVPVPVSRQRTVAPLGALVMLTSGADSIPRRLHGPDVLASILASFHRPLVPQLLGRLPALLPQVASLAQSLPVYRWSPPTQGSILPSLEFLAGHLHAATVPFA